MDRLYLHPDNPHPRVITQAQLLLQAGEVLAFPTVSGYALGCMLENKKGLDEIRRIRQLPRDHHFSLLCREISELAQYAELDNTVFRLLKSMVPGPYTFILPATRQVPKRLMHPKKRTIGIRITPHPVVRAILEAIDAPLMAVSLKLPGMDEFVVDIDHVASKLHSFSGAILDSGDARVSPTQIVDCTTDEVRLLRG
jgi:tRNA threonylcarbamoyl adenosine modification protein (Sua5/YciO/YrdC/YwlC family)